MSNQPRSITVDAARQLVTVVLTGRVSTEELQQAFQAMVDHPGFSSGFDSLWDFRDASLVDITVDGIQTIVDYVERHKDQRGAGSVLIVAPNDLDYGVSRTYEALAARLPTPIHTFRTMDEVHAWRAQTHGARKRQAD